VRSDKLPSLIGDINLNRSCKNMLNRLNLVKTLSVVTASAACVVLGGIGNAQAATIIDTTPSWDGFQSIGQFGENNFGTFGQTFTVGSDNVLNNFTFYVDDETNSAPVNFAAYVMAWDGTKASGSILYQSGQQTTAGSAGQEPFTFNTGGINLTAGQQYVAFLSVSNFFNGTTDSSFVGYVGSDTYAGGELFFQFNGNNFGALSTNSWYSFGNAELAFTANLSGSTQSVPEPFTIVGTLIGGTAALRMKKKLKSNHKI
jgi:hypothetical protein